MQGKLIFITGTDTGAGKTLFTCMALSHLRSLGVEALGLKPFCSGSRSDARHIRTHSHRDLPLQEINPWYFEPPLAPGAMPEKIQVSKQALMEHIQETRKQCDLLLVEGAGGLMSPLGADYHLGHVTEALRPHVVLTAPNKLGVLNQVLLNVTYLQSFMPTKNIHVVLMGRKNTDLSVKSNAKLLRSWINECTVLELPYLGSNAKSTSSVQHHVAKNKKLLTKALNYS
ncbi:MAG: dethiobiotin synthase [Verrucomicrobia bacterium]|jgi:dethiobiotin synthetase|nr:dethiobiotin synthase [Verrucomicrobiota bacterium]